MPNKAVAVIEPGRVDVVDIPIPEFNDYECLVRVKAGGICNSTDLKIIKNQLPNKTINYPAILGHENAGEIIETGKRVRAYKIGDKVMNAAGRVGVGSPYHLAFGALAQYGIAHDVRAMLDDGVAPPFKIAPEDYFCRVFPQHMSYEDAVIVMTMKENYSAMINFGVAAGMDVLVYGDGPVGLGLASNLRALGVKFVACVGHWGDRLDRIKKIAKADIVINARNESVEGILEDKKFDLVIDAVGKIDILMQAAPMLKPGGKIGMYGVLEKSGANVNLLDLPNNINVHTYCYPYREQRTHGDVMALVASGKLDPKDYYSHILPIDDAAKAVDMIKSREAYKIILSM